tara:strand:- start:691 stop:1065 length:375 start_codon:yes stop_codon:yes gene_type:complete
MLSNRDELKALALINFYEYSFGLISGTVINFFYKTIFPFTKKESVFKSVPLLFILVIPLITAVLYLRQHVVYYLPVLKDMDLKKHENFSHPPPLAFAFGFWQTQNQLKLRNDRFTKRLSSVLKL